MKTLHYLIGPKGAGKTFIGTMIEKHLGIHFLQVEPIWLSLRAEQDGRAKVEDEIDRIFHREDDLVIESLGIGENFQKMHDSLKQRYRIRYIKVSSDLGICLERVNTRDRADHIAVSTEKVIEYNRVAAQVELPWDTIIDNNGPATPEDIIRQFSHNGPIKQLEAT